MIEPPVVGEPNVLWTPPPDIRETTEIGRYLTWLEQERGLAFHGYGELWQWSTGCRVPRGSRAHG